MNVTNLSYAAFRKRCHLCRSACTYLPPLIKIILYDLRIDLRNLDSGDLKIGYIRPWFTNQSLCDTRNGTGDDIPEMMYLSVESCCGDLVIDWLDLHEAAVILDSRGRWRFSGWINRFNLQ